MFFFVTRCQCQLHPLSFKNLQKRCIAFEVLVKQAIWVKKMSLPLNPLSHYEKDFIYHTKFQGYKLRRRSWHSWLKFPTPPRQNSISPTSVLPGQPGLMQNTFLLSGQCKTQTADCRQWNRGKMQTECKIAGCRLRVKCRLGTKCRPKTAYFLNICAPSSLS